MSLRDDLIAVRALIDTPEKWGKGQGFRAPDDVLCAESACSKSLYGADKQAAWTALERQLPDAWKDSYVHSYNDDPATTHADIMALFDRAIEAAS